MIIVQLKGGLGNQMFQYALARKLSLQFRVPFKLDVSNLRPGLTNFLGVTTLRKYALGDFDIHAGFARNKDLPFLSKFPSTRYNNFLNKLVSTFQPRGRQVVRETSFSFDQNYKRIRSAGADIYLDGFWISEKYFKDITPVIRKDFSLKKKMSVTAVGLANQISHSNSVSIHVRRRDYVTNPNTKQYHGVCDLNYYRKAIRRMTKHVSAPYFFIFSDDINWAKQNLRIEYPTVFVDHFGSDTEELILMSLCKHNIIANSSFSWWGAWLNKNPNKIVIAPKKWFRAKIDDSDIVPIGWIRI
jgi:hypothetical protein